MKIKIALAVDVNAKSQQLMVLVYLHVQVHSLYQIENVFASKDLYTKTVLAKIKKL